MLCTRGGLALLLTAALFALVVVADDSLPNPIATCGNLATTVTKLSDGLAYEGTTPPQGYPPTVYSETTIAASLKYNVGDLNDVTNPSPAGSSIQFARPYLRALSCMDGRQTGYVLAAPGAEVGVMVIAMSSYLSAKGALSNYTAGSYNTLLNAYFTQRESLDDAKADTIVNGFRSLTLHTDYDALINMLTVAGILDANGKPVNTTNSTFSLSDIGATWNGSTLTTAQKQAFLDSLTEANAAYFGCGHIYRMLSTWDFPFTKSLVLNVVKGVIRYMFNIDTAPAALYSSRIQFDVLKGKHQEGAVVFFESQLSDAPCRYAAAAAKDYTFRQSDLLPMFTPRVVQAYNASVIVQSVLLVHEQAIDFRLEEWARFFTQLAAADLKAGTFTYYTSAPDASTIKSTILTSSRSLWTRVKANAFSGCTADLGLCFNYLPQYQVKFTRVYSPEYQTIASVMMILSTLVLWFLLWRCYASLDKGEKVLPDMKTVDKLFNKTMSTGKAFIDDTMSLVHPHGTPTPATGATSGPITTSTGLVLDPAQQQNTTAYVPVANENKA